ncbi:ABC transporter ATP-binding protein [Undibacterium rugosum]|uniref:ABC transporter ATP-binding protein n=1 Tax=Undibacterium rugosum TaxID=2762291 RepID=UPI001B824B9F|nr:ABC transporter ATP-binding protein [Undibacterium rugosum]MBR7779711.1 ABC transporter ATP-binding protein [Undibacterium rugosum]
MEVRYLNLHIGQRHLVDKLHWQVQPGECWCIIGRNGAGKSTLLRTLSGMREIEADGEVLFEGRDIRDWRLADLAKIRAYLTQSRHDAFGYSALDTVLSARHPFQDAHYWDAGDDVALALSALQALDVADLAERDVRSLSGGERQRVAIAALLAQDAQCMLLDEPANALDLAHQVSVMQLFSELCLQQQKSVVMVSHDLNLAHRVATHALLLMGDGRWLSGSRDQMFTVDQLSECLGHPIQRFQHNGQTLFLPQT